MSEFHFSQLTPDLILDAIESTGLYVESGLLPLNSYENRVYQFLAEDKKRYVAKFYRPERWTTAQIKEEHEFSQQLLADEIPLVAPLSISGETLLQYKGYRFALFPSVGGRQFEVDNLEQLEWMGRFVGRIHQVGKQQAFQYRPTISLEDYLTKPRQKIIESEFIPLHMQNPFVSVVDHVIEACYDQYQCHDVQRLHGDCHAGNILWNDGPSFVDLDDCRMGPAVQDLWMMLSGDEQQQQVQLDTLLTGYEEFCEFPEEQLTLIEPLRAMRMIHYMGWLTSRWADPAFPRNFPWFTSDKYWEQQTLALKEQLSELQHNTRGQNFNL